MSRARPKISLIGAMSENRVIGLGNRMPWHLPEDLKRFRRITQGHPVIMGRKTYESIGRLLPGRLNIIVTRQKDFRVEGAVIAASLEEAVALASERDTSEVFVIGGGEIYRQALGRADRIHLTVIHRSIEGDAFFPEVPQGQFVETAREDFAEPMPFSFLTLDRSP